MLPRVSSSCLVYLVLLSCVAEGVRAAAEPSVPAKTDYLRDIKPIFEKNCYKCHGPQMQKNELRLDVKEFALKGGTSGPAIIPGKSAESPLIRNVSRLADATPMPPKGDPLTAEQIGLLRAWIDQGAIWPEESGVPMTPTPLPEKKKSADHWSFKSPVHHDPPEVKNASWPRNEIDRFVLSRLEKEGLSPSPEVDRATLIRRLSLDLIGLPPTVEEVDSFLADKSPNAYENVVERLLASPHYGERWARPWLDAARYADTNGFEKDRTRSIWPYRDWVINALNADMPFNEFAIEQLAGDMLPGATRDQKIATGFHRNSMTNEEGGIDVEEYRFASVVDRVQATGAIFLGLTVGCAQCHDHKYDPISQREYYQFFAFLNNADEPEIEIPSSKEIKKRQQALDQISKLEGELESKFPPSEKSFASSFIHLSPQEQSRIRLAASLNAWEEKQSKAVVHWTVLDPLKFASDMGATMTKLPDRSILVSGDRPNRDVYNIELPTSLKDITALRLEVIPDDSLPNHGPGRGAVLGDGNFMLSEIEIAAAPLGSAERGTAVTLQSASADYPPQKFDAAKAIDGVLDTGWAIEGGIGKQHWAVFELKDKTGFEPGTKLSVKLIQRFIHQQTIGRFRISVTTDSHPVKASAVPPDIEALLLKSRSSWTESESAAIKRAFLLAAPELAEQQKEIAKLRATLPTYTTTLVMQERAAPRTTQIHARGEFLRTGVAVEPGVPAILPPLPEGAPRNRLALARWLVDGKNPLTARVEVNRMWQAFFGRGIVATVQDFGTQGDAPTHPELLDWLATEFMRRGWSMKAMHRLIVTSAAYRQDSRVPPNLLASDPNNLLLARGPRFRVDAETVRDIALAAGGLLDLKIGGPSVFPPEPRGVNELAYGSPAWPASSGGDRYRRGLYTHLKRTAPYPALITFDGPTAETACLRRNRSNTPLQALTLLNDEVFAEAAQALGRRVMAAPAGDPAGKARLAFRLCLGREPKEAELTKLVAFYDQQLARINSGALDAAKLAPVAADQKVAESNGKELAALTALSRVLLNLDETITKE